MAHIIIQLILKTAGPKNATVPPLLRYMVLRVMHDFLSLGLSTVDGGNLATLGIPNLQQLLD